MPEVKEDLERRVDAFMGEKLKVMTVERAELQRETNSDLVKMKK